ncbi:hypothetical protein [Pseudarthrobacter sp. NIBRBAC000502770]|uniref:hypothetical protein n=1 Tax=Pseudarthrobacter sp. NIBRBAC000502770 TaxID=2590785 RepID=UPI00114003D5|nr:hypothetical protein [Pseudarthrobacter sp. NIBRBAC000502770]QDG88080.1 hypothetical protein NIBR502770_05970 [Pseudarthrobacter sp. NIBRBAC000502770]
MGAFVASVIGGLVALMVVRLTNKHQSKVATHGRVVAAFADFHAALSQMPRRYMEGRDVIQRLVIEADAASNRITMDIEDWALAEELSLWASDLGLLSIRAAEFREEGYLDRSEECWLMLRRGLGFLVGTTQRWGRIPAKDRKNWAPALTSLREKLAADRDSLGG